MSFAFLPKIPVDGEFSQEHNAMRGGTESSLAQSAARSFGDSFAADSGVTRKQKRRSLCKCGRLIPFRSLAGAGP
jgi:hypothetical protein